LRSSLGKLLLAHSITLTPGTLSIDLRDDRLLVHWIDSPPDTDTDRATRAIAESFEKHISGFLE
jgi:multicomponent Na+:H+ antiporter subunit E